MQAVLVALTAAALISAAPDEKQKIDPIRVLSVTGVDSASHDWKERSAAISRILAEDKRFEVRVVEDPEFLAENDLFDYDVALLHFRNLKPLAREKQIKANLTSFVKQGKGLVVIHGASGAFPDWPEFRNLIGRVWGPKHGHDPRGPFAVKIVNTKHPITRTMTDFQTDDELYFGFAGDRPIKVLATVRSKLTGKDEPAAFVLQYGKGRVFHTPLGHDGKALLMPGVAELLRRGCAWAAGMPPKRYHIVDFDQLPAVVCPCGTARRAFVNVDDFPATIHRTEIAVDAKPHYHRRLTEVYYILQCDVEAKMQLDDRLVPVKPGTCILIPPGVVHRAVGRMTVLIVVLPKFDPNDEVIIDGAQGSQGISQQGKFGGTHNRR